MNLFERALLNVAPAWAASRARNRLRAMMYSNGYEAATPGRFRKTRRDQGSGNMLAQGAVLPVRNLARDLDRNHDLAHGILNTLVQNTVGAAGIGVEFTPIGADGNIDEAFGARLHELYDNWSRRPEVTFQHDWPSAQRMLARSWFRDGEVLFQMLTGNVPTLDHGTQVPFSIELVEADLLAMDFVDLQRGILHGVERNQWQRPVAYHIYLQHPSDPANTLGLQRKRVSADNMRHIKLVDRIGQVRGVSLFASVLVRLDNIKDYETSEQIAAKVAASMAAVIKKGDPQSFDNASMVDENGKRKKYREMQFTPGMIFDDLLPGESIEMIDSSRPYSGLENFRGGQLRAVSRGVGVSYSSASGDYNGTYSAQRQELVEGWGAYAILSREMICQGVQPVVETLIQMALLSGQVTMPKGMRNPLAAMYTPPSMPWIDPQREADAYETLENQCLISGQEIIRRRGGVPRDVLKQEEIWRKAKADAGVSPAASAKTTVNLTGT